MSTINTIETCKEQENTYRFDGLTHNDFNRLGEILRDYSVALEKPVAVEVAIGDLVVFRYIPQGRGIYESKWLQAKRNSVMAFGVSSLHTQFKMTGKGLSQAKDFSALDPGQYAVSGGGFPIKSTSGLLLGSICVSGLSGEEDHQILVQALEQFSAER